MKEERLQFDIVTWFRNNKKNQRGSLFATLNENSKGKNQKGIGLHSGVSDLIYQMPNGLMSGIELKILGTRHELKHLKEQYYFLEGVIARGGYGLFIYSLDQFKEFIEGSEEVKDYMCMISMYEMASIISKGEEKGSKTVKLMMDDRS